MGLLANLKLRKKLLVALTPLIVMVVAAGLYSSIEAKRIDTWYSLLIDDGIKSVYKMDAARSLVMRYGLFLDRLIVETDPARRQSLNAQLEDSYTEYQARIAEAKRLYPAYSQQIAAAAARFEKAVADSRPARTAALANQNQKVDRKSTRLNSSHGYISYAVFCLKKKKKNRTSVSANVL